MFPKFNFQTSSFENALELSNPLPLRDEASSYKYLTADFYSPSGQRLDGFMEQSSRFGAGLDQARGQSFRLTQPKGRRVWANTDTIVTRR